MVSRKSWWRRCRRRGCNSVVTSSPPEFHACCRRKYTFVEQTDSLFSGREHNMKKTFAYLTCCGLSALALFFLALAKPAIAGTIRIIGDRTPMNQSNSGGPTAAEPPSSSVGGSAIIGFNGDKQSTGQKPASEQAARTEPSQSTKEYNVPTTAEGESLSEETAEQQRIVPTIADEECLTAATMACKEANTPADQTSPATSSAYFPTVSSTDVKPFILKPVTSEKTERLPEQNLAIETAQPKSSSNSDFPLGYWLMQMRTKFQEQWRQP